jgi:hypothetical protein
MSGIKSRAQETRVEAWAARLDRLSRLVRIVLSLLITLELVVLLSIVIDRALLDRVYEGEVGAMTPALIAAGLGIVLYAIGWWALVGFETDDQPWRAGTPAVVYVTLGVIGLFLMFMLAVLGLLLSYIL